jgi:hypothetical protein
MKIVVTGGRDFIDTIAIWEALDRLHSEYSFSVLIDGKARGVDTIAHK